MSSDTLHPVLDPERLLLPARTLDLTGDGFVIRVGDGREETLTDSPHLEFARACLTDPRADWRATRYHELLEQGGASLPCRDFAALVTRTEHEEQPPVPVARRDDRARVVLAGEHRLGALAARERPTVSVVEVPASEARHVLATSTPRASDDLLARVGRPLDQHAESLAAIRSRLLSDGVVPGAASYHPLPFAGLDELPTTVDPASAFGRLALALSVLESVDGATVLDIGCNAGFYSFALERRGANVTGLDPRGPAVDLANELARLHSLSATFREVTVDAAWAERQDRHDVILCFSMAHWIARAAEQDGGDGMEAVRVFLRALSERSTHLFFDAPVNWGKTCFHCPEGDEVRYQLDLLNEATGKQVRHLGSVRPYPANERHVFHCGRR